MTDLVIRNYKKIKHLAHILSKEYSENFLRLLVIYQDISASEAATRLNLHIKTAQDFLEELVEAGIVGKKEAEEKKRPYFRYFLQQPRLKMFLDITSLYRPLPQSEIFKLKIKERANSGAIFKEAPGNRIAVLQVFSGQGRNREEKRFNLSASQGRFLFYLPFPTEKPLSIKEIMARARLQNECLPEIEDLIQILDHYQIIERQE